MPPKKSSATLSKEDSTAPALSPASESEEEDSSVYDSDIASYYSDDEQFEDQGSSDEDDDLVEEQAKDDDSSADSLEILDDMTQLEEAPRSWNKRNIDGKQALESSGNDKTATWMHTDDFSSDDEDEEGTSNRIGRVPLHWYDEYEHIGYDGQGNKVVKTASLKDGDLLDQAIRNSDDKKDGKFVVHDALNDRNVALTDRQIEIIRRIQGGAYAHPEHDGNSDYIDYYSGVDRQIMGMTTNRNQPKARFQPSEWERLQVKRLLDKLEKGDITMDYLTGKVRDMNDLHKKKDGNSPFMLWTGEDELPQGKGPQHIAAPKVKPPGHAESYIPPDEYLPSEQDLKGWSELDVQDRPHGLMVPKKFPNLRSVGAYPHAVREAFERCLDLYLCPRVMKRRLNIDPESLVPQLPKASDLRPFPTAMCIEYKTPGSPMIRCVSPSPDGQFLASGATDGIVRLWEVQTGRLLKSWNVSEAIGTLGRDSNEYVSSDPKPVVCLEWNPNKMHHCLLAAVGTCAVIISSGTGDAQDSEITEALLAEAVKGGNVKNSKAEHAVKWIPLGHKENDLGVSVLAKSSGMIVALMTKREVASVRWHRKGDYFVTVSPKAGASAVLIHQLSKGNSQKPFSKAKGEAQLACFHPNKPFLFVASQQHVRVYNLVKQSLVKRLVSGCRFISSLDVHPSGDHLIVGSLDRRVIWFDLDLSDTPYKTLKYHERALRSVGYHSRYPLMASASDDGTVHVFHSMVYSDLVRNPLLVPVKILRGHNIKEKLGVLTLSFHPTQPWLFTGGADGRILLFQDI